LALEVLIKVLDKIFETKKVEKIKKLKTNTVAKINNVKTFITSMYHSMHSISEQEQTNLDSFSLMLDAL